MSSHPQSGGRNRSGAKGNKSSVHWHRNSVHWHRHSAIHRNPKELLLPRVVVARAVITYLSKQDWTNAARSTHMLDDCIVLLAQPPFFISISSKMNK